MNLCIFIILFLFVAQVSEAKNYKVKLISIDKCKQIAGKVDESKPVIYEASVKKINRHKSVISSNFTILRSTGPVRLNFRIYQLKKTSRDMLFNIEKVDCQNPFSYRLVRVLHLKMDNNCMAFPGNYVSDNINLQDYTRMLTKLMFTPGKLVYYELEFYTDANGIAACYTITTDILELK